MKRLKREDFLLLATKLMEKIDDPSNAKEYYELVKRSKIITQQLKAIENPNLVDIESVTIEHPKTSHKSLKVTRQAEKVSQVGCGKNSYSRLYSEKRMFGCKNNKVI